MKLQKVSAILGLTVCLIGTQIPGNYAANVAQAAQEEPEGISQGDSGVLDESQDMPVWPDEGSTAGKTTSGQTEGNEGSGSGTEGNEGSGSGVEENEGSGTGTEENEGSGAGTGEIPGQDTRPEKPDAGVEPGGGAGTEVPGQAPSGSGNIKVQPRINGGGKGIANYRPSAKFTDYREKIK